VRIERRVVLGGLYLSALLAVWGIYTMRHWPADHPILTAFRLGFYWNEPKWRWLLLFVPVAAGMIGLVRMARRGKGELLVWLLGFYAIGVLGSIALQLGHKVPLYYRFILLCQLPLVIGMAYWLVHARSRTMARLATAGLVCVFVFKVATLVSTSHRLTYFGAKLQSAWSIGRVIPPHSGLVASDPGSSYFVPIASQNHVLTLGLGHADSGAEQALAMSGYQLLHQVYTGDNRDAALALQAMWAKGVRWVLVEKFTTLIPPDLASFYAAPYTSLVDWQDSYLAARYNTRLASVGRLVADDGEYSIYRLDSTLIAHTAIHVPPLSVSAAAQAREILHRLASGNASLAPAADAQLHALGFRLLTYNSGWLGANPSLTVSGSQVTSPDSVTVTLPKVTYSISCGVHCSTERATVRALGTTVLDDTRFTIVRL
jgi:hypothetical protein